MDSDDAMFGEERSGGAWTVVAIMAAVAVGGLSIFAWQGRAGVLALLLAAPFVLLGRAAWRRLGDQE